MIKTPKRRRYLDPDIFKASGRLVLRSGRPRKHKEIETMAKKPVEPQKVFKQGEYDALMHVLREKPVMDRESLAGIEHRLRERLKEYRGTKSANPIDLAVVSEIIKALGQKVPAHA